MEPVMILIGVVVAAILYFVFRTTPADRVQATEAHLNAGRFAEAEKEIAWLIQLPHPRGIPLRGRLHLAKAKTQKAVGTEQALAELDHLYALRRRHPAAAELLTAVERDSAVVLTASVRALALPAEKQGAWEQALAWYARGLAHFEQVTALRPSAAFTECEAGAVRCHAELLNRELQSRLTTARLQQGIGQFAAAAHTLQTATNWLADPAHPALQRRAAPSLQPLIQAATEELANAELLAQVGELLTYSAAGRRAATSATFQPVFDQLEQARRLLKDGRLRAHPRFAAYSNQIETAFAESHGRRGELLEKQQDYPAATRDYEQAATHYHALGRAGAEATARVRQGIIVFKARKGGTLPPDTAVGQADTATRREYAYRAVLYFLESNLPARAQPLLPHLAGLREEPLLRQAVGQQAREALRQEAAAACALALADPNSFAQLTQLHDDLPALSARVAALDAAGGRQLTDLQPYVFGRLLLTGLTEGRYAELLARLTADARFLANAEQLKNVGIVCLRLALNQQLTAQNYEWIIALWLTALYANAVLVASLERTSWDDPYTFTLADSLGLKRGLTIPENVNFDATSAGNIAIGETQRELRQLFERALHTIADAHLQQLAVACYDAQQAALRGLIEYLNAAPANALAALPIPVAPGVGTRWPDSNARIVQTLLAPYHNNSTYPEAALRVALPYRSSPLAQPPLQAYLTALDVEQQLTDGFQPPRTRLKGLPPQIRADAPKTQFYPQLRQRLLQRLTADVGTIHRTEADGLLNDIFPALIAGFPEHEPFRLMGAHHLLDWCISSLNAKKMSFAQALPHLTQGSQWAPNEPRIADNLIRCFAFGCESYTDEQGPAQRALLSALQATLAYVRQHPSPALLAALRHILQPKQQEIEREMRAAGVPIDDLVRAAASGGTAAGRFTQTGLDLGYALSLLRQMSVVQPVPHSTTKLPF